MLKIILVQDFCPLKIKITQFPNGFRLNCFTVAAFVITFLGKGLIQFAN